MTPNKTNFPIAGSSNQQKANNVTKKQISNMMKAPKTLLAALVAIACASVAQAQTTVRFTGSTAFRLNTHNAILHIYDSGVTYGFTGSSLGGAQQAIFHGTIGGQTVHIKTAWSGAEGGMQTVAGSVAIAFLPDSTSTSTGGTSGATVATPGNGGDVAVPDVGMADQFQSSSAFFGLYRGVTYPTLTESPNSPVGIVPFKFVANKGAPAGLTNINTQQARALFGAGALPLSFFTGNNTDETKTVVATGRDPDSGTRLNTSAEIGLGPQASVKHWQPLSAGGTLVNTIGVNIDHFAPWPASVINGIPVAVFNGGYASGGDLSRMLANTCPANFTVVSYGSVNDVDANSIPNQAVELSYNGVLLGNTGGNYNNATVLTEGKYTFWCYEHVMYRSGTPTPVKNVADTVANQIRTADAPVFLSSMKVERATDGSVVFPTFNTIPPPQ